MKSLINCSLQIVLMLCVPLTSHAFKLDTHVWVGQQIINDLEDDGELSIKLNGRMITLNVPAHVKNAILANKSAYLMGNIGPDAAPDVVVGQTAVHPGVKNNDGENIGWQTNDWLEYLLSVSSSSDLGTAYTYGYLGHAAADVFAHTYVNQYAGDIFSLTDGESLVEQRHFVLENFIGKYTPQLKDHLGRNLGSPWEQVQMEDELAVFVRDNLIYSDQVQREYWEVSTARHLAAYYEFRKGIDSLAEDGIWHDIDIAVTMIVAAYFDIELSPDEADQVVGVAQSVLDELNRGSENVQELTNIMYDKARQFDDEVFRNVAAAKNRMEEVEQEWLAKHQELRRKLLDIEDLPSCPRIWICEPDPKWYHPGNLDCGWRDDPICEATRDAIRVSNNLIIETAESLENEALGLKNNLAQATINLRDETVRAIDSLHTIQNSLTDFAQMISADVSPIQSLLRGWRSDVDIAMTEYVKAANQAMVNTMNPDESAIEPITEWFDCYHYSIIGMPSSVSGCEFRDSLTNLKESIGNIITIVEEAGFPGASELNNLRDQIIEDLVDDLKEEVAEEIVDLLPDEVGEILELLDLDVNDEVLNHYFTKAESISDPKGLIMIQDMADRVKAEMSLTSAEKFDPEKYAVAYNSVVLAKLALLDKYGFESLAIQSGSFDYVDFLLGLDNVVAQAFGNIDGNHQWMPLPPPIPNSFNTYSPVNYTYSSDRSALGELGGLGFVPWKGDMKNKLFRKIFIGPLSPGMDSPNLINKTNLVSQDYPYQPCAAHPFPQDINDRTCIAIMLIPIFSLLLN